MGARIRVSIRSACKVPFVGEQSAALFSPVLRWMGGADRGKEGAAITKDCRGGCCLLAAAVIYEWLRRHDARIHNTRYCSCKHRAQDRGTVDGRGKPPSNRPVGCERRPRTAFIRPSVHSSIHPRCVVMAINNRRSLSRVRDRDIFPIYVYVLRTFLHPLTTIT